jgi:FHA domain
MKHIAVAAMLVSLSVTGSALAQTQTPTTPLDGHCTDAAWPVVTCDFRLTPDSGIALTPRMADVALLFDGTAFATTEIHAAPTPPGRVAIVYDRSVADPRALAALARVSARLQGQSQLNWYDAAQTKLAFTEAPRAPLTQRAPALRLGVCQAHADGADAIVIIADGALGQRTTPGCTLAQLTDQLSARPAPIRVLALRRGPALFGLEQLAGLTSGSTVEIHERATLDEAILPLLGQLGARQQARFDVALPADGRQHIATLRVQSQAVSVTLNALPVQPVLRELRIREGTREVPAQALPVNADITLEPVFLGRGLAWVAIDTPAGTITRTEPPFHVSFNTSMLPSGQPLTFTLRAASHGPAGRAESRHPLTFQTAQTTSWPVAAAGAAALIGLAGVGLVVWRRSRHPATRLLSPAHALDALPMPAHERDEPTLLPAAAARTLNQPIGSWHLRFEHTQTVESLVGSTGACRLIGRSPGEDGIRINSSFASAQHARIDLGSNGPTVTDLGSTNGTRVDGRRIPPHSAVPLAAGSEVSFADVSARVETSSEASHT